MRPFLVSLSPLFHPAIVSSFFISQVYLIVYPWRSSLDEKPPIVSSFFRLMNSFKLFSSNFLTFTVNSFLPLSRNFQLKSYEKKENPLTETMSWGHKTFFKRWRMSVWRTVSEKQFVCHAREGNLLTIFPPPICYIQATFFSTTLFPLSLLSCIIFPQSILHLCYIFFGCNILLSMVNKKGNKWFGIRKRFENYWLQ